MVGLIIIVTKNIIYIEYIYILLYTIYIPTIIINL